MSVSLFPILPHSDYVVQSRGGVHNVAPLEEILYCFVKCCIFSDRTFIFISSRLQFSVQSFSMLFNNSCCCISPPSRRYWKCFAYTKKSFSLILYSQKWCLGLLFICFLFCLGSFSSLICSISFPFSGSLFCGHRCSFSFLP